jgi:hypothetical protein
MKAGLYKLCNTNEKRTKSGNRQHKGYYTNASFIIYHEDTRGAGNG